jgi:hypothetical protein
MGIRMTISAGCESEVAPTAQGGRRGHLLKAVAILAGNRGMFPAQEVPGFRMVEVCDLPARHLMTGCTILLELPCMSVGVAISTLFERKATKLGHRCRPFIRCGSVAVDTVYRLMFASQRKSCLLVIDGRPLPTTLVVTGGAVLIELPFVHIDVTIGTTRKGQRTIGRTRVAIRMDDESVTGSAVYRLMQTLKRKSTVLVIESCRFEALHIVACAARGRLELPPVFILVTIDAGREGHGPITAKTLTLVACLGGVALFARNLCMASIQPVAGRVVGKARCRLPALHGVAAKAVIRQLIAMLVCVTRKATPFKPEVCIGLCVTCRARQHGMFVYQRITRRVMIEAQRIPADHLVVEAPVVAVAIDAVTGDVCVIPRPLLQAPCQCFVTRQAAYLRHLFPGDVALGAVRQTFKLCMRTGKISR